MTTKAFIAAWAGLHRVSRLLVIPVAVLSVACTSAPKRDVSQPVAAVTITSLERDSVVALVRRVWTASVQRDARSMRRAGASRGTARYLRQFWDDSVDVVTREEPPLLTDIYRDREDPSVIFASFAMPWPRCTGGSKADPAKLGFVVSVRGTWQIIGLYSPEAPC